jgi:hypothetical protein
MKSTTASNNNQRDCISVFIDVIAQCKSEEWRRKITAMQNLIVGLDLQQHEYIASISGKTRSSSTSFSSPGGAAGPAAWGVQRNLIRRRRRMMTLPRIIP